MAAMDPKRIWVRNPSIWQAVTTTVIPPQMRINKYEYAIMTPTTVGSCLCGTVQFQISGEFESFFLCHCKRCRKGTGSAHAANLFSSTAAVDWVSGLDSVQTYRVPETRHESTFCIKCGSPLPSVQLEDALVIVPAGSIDSALDIRPDAHICFASRAEWDACLENIPRLDDLPD